MSWESTYWAQDSSTNNGYPYLLSTAVPSGSAVDYGNIDPIWLIDGLVNDGYPALVDTRNPIGSAVNLSVFGTWAVSLNELPTLKNTSEPAELGAFCHAASLRSITIPANVKYIGENAFTNSGLTSVKIASDCVYSGTSFPEGCAVNFY